ncbi:Aldo/keto reductase [Irpex rosettiformis]|uniref:Aldo/keto reductase n=1 Tax=Irpex rosettiformis TaxID=378272 RepID=A0ACB8U152_9APHY|nr:Aldo/keto reductase [Irpex rosettiformis]
MTQKATYSYLGKTGLRVSVPVIGGMTYGSPTWVPWVLPEKKALPILKAAWDSGLNTIDTANMYSNGESERIIGKFIQQYEIPRSRLVIFTKARYIVAHNHPQVLTGFGEPEVIDKQEYINAGGLSRKALFSQVHDSLERLQAGYVDVLFVHGSDPNTPHEETMKALHDLVESGKVHYLGVPTLHLWELAQTQAVAEKNGWTKFSFVEFEHSLLYHPEELEMLVYCNRSGLGTLAFAPLMDDHLARPIRTRTERSKLFNGTVYDKPRRNSDKEIIKRVEELSKKKGWTMSQVALAWSIGKVTNPIVGMNSIERVHEAILGDRKLSDEEIKCLEEP